MQEARVLVAHDDACTRRCVRRVLEQQPLSASFWEAGNGLEALKLSRQYLPDLVLLDAHLSRMDGIEVTHRLRAERPGVRIIVMGAYDFLREEAMRAGADEFVQSDRGCEALSSAIRRLLLAEQPAHLGA